MRTMNLQVEVGADGKLRMEMPTDLPPGRFDATLIVQEPNENVGPPYDTLEGILAGKLSAEIDIDAALHEMNEGWKRKLGLEVE